MADGRCFTVSNSSKLVNQYLVEKAGINRFDNFSYRQALQHNPEIVYREIEKPCGQGTLLKGLPYK
jgi:hypothetical protein